MYDQNLKFMQDMFFYTQNICTWCVTPDMQLVSSNCTEQEFFFNMFSVSRCQNVIKKHFSTSIMPLLTTDSIGFVWISVCHYTKASNSVLIYILGPVFTSEMTPKYLRQHCHKKKLTAKATERLLYFVKDIPTITSPTASRYASMLHYCVNSETVSLTDVEVWNEPSTDSTDPEWGDSQWHGSWISEQRLFQSIMEGRIDNHTNINTGRIGNIGGGDPLRQAKNEMIVFATICCRASILGGISSEGAFNLSDYYIQLIEAADTVSGVHNIGSEMHMTYIERVRKAKKAINYSPLVRACKEYVESHICEKIVLKNLATEIGYNEHYISRTFKSELGESLTDYINHQKVLLAQSILEDSHLSIADISERLAFSSSSYFIALFKKYVGITPTEYRHDKRKT